MVDALLCFMGSPLNEMLVPVLHHNMSTFTVLIENTELTL